MKILGQVAFLLLLGGICCQNNRNAKSSSKPSRRVANQAADAVIQPSSEDNSNPRPEGAPEAGREGNAGARPAAQQSPDMRLHFLKNTLVTCNDGTAAG